jgi:hypothetical protein
LLVVCFCCISFSLLSITFYFYRFYYCLKKVDEYNDNNNNINDSNNNNKNNNYEKSVKNNVLEKEFLLFKSILFYPIGMLFIWIPILIIYFKYFFTNEIRLKNKDFFYYLSTQYSTVLAIIFFYNRFAILFLCSHFFLVFIYHY